MTVGLAMIVRDAADTIERCLATARPHIDCYTIIDTGSVDGTPELIKRSLDGVKGELYLSEWENFEVNRTELMEKAYGTADYLMLLDADMEVIHPGRLPRLTAEVYMGRLLGNNLDYTLPILVRGDKRWAYKGVAHSYLHCDDGYDSEVLPGLEIMDHSSTGAEKLQRDLEALSKEHARDPLGARTAFYLAQTYFDLDMFPEAIAAYRYRANLQGWDEERFYARFMLGVLLCEHVSFAEGAQELLKAWSERPSRIEPLRCLANAAHSVADKAAYPSDQLFVHRDKYVQPKPTPITTVPPLPVLASNSRRRVKLPLKSNYVSAVIVTRGNVDLQPIIDSVPYDDIVIWDNSKRQHDYKVFGRYAAIPETKNPVIYWQDDDIIFTEHDALLASYEPGVVACNMDQPWIDGAGYGDFLGMVGAGSLCDANLPARIWAEYFAAHPFDDDVLTNCDFVFGTMAPFKRVDLGYRPREFTDDPDRLYRQPGQTERKWRMIERGRAMLEQVRAA